MTNLTQVYVTVNRQAAIERGINGTDTPVLVDLDVSRMSEEDRADVAYRLELEPSSGGYGDPAWPAPRLCDIGEDGTGRYKRPMTVTEPTEKGVLAAAREARARADEVQAQRKAREDEKRERKQRLDSAIEACNLSGMDIYSRSGDSVILRGEYNYTSGWLSADEIAAGAESLRERARTRREEIAKKAAEQRGWIAAHGSRALRTMLAEGIECEKTYQIEREEYEDAEFTRRLKSERPGWVEVDPSEIDEDVADVSDRAIAVLLAGREQSKTCRLAEHEDDYVCVDDFAGRLIMWPED